MQTWLGSHVAIAVVKANSCTSDSTPSLGNSICPYAAGAALKSKSKQKKKKKKKSIQGWVQVLAHGFKPQSGFRLSQRCFAFIPRSRPTNVHSTLDPTILQV